MRAALYARVSSEEQVEGYSIDAQRRAFAALVKDKQWTVYQEFVDEGKSARSDNINKRPAFREMIEDALSHRFDVLIVHKLDRFARNLRLTLEYFDKLATAGVTLISISEQMDFSTPSGKVHLALLGAFAQYYSDNLSQETRKGWTERREQGMYCGTLPFGAVKGEDGVPIPDMEERKVFVDGNEMTVCNYDGLRMAFDLSAQGKSDKEIAIALNVEGYRTTGTHGSRPFSKDTIKNILKNRFYIGYIGNGNGDWIKAKHSSFIQPSIFEEAQRMREKRNTSRNINRARAKVYSLSGIARCADCGNTLRSFKGKRRVRLVCNGRLKSGDCTQPSTLLEVYEQQLRAYLSVFTIPVDYQEKILEAQRKLQSAYAVEKTESGFTSEVR